MAVAEHGRAIMEIESCSRCSRTVTRCNYSPNCLFHDRKGWEIIALPLVSISACTLRSCCNHFRIINIYSSGEQTCMKWTYNGEVISSICLSVYACPHVLFAKLVIGVRYEVSAHSRTHKSQPWKTERPRWI
jgi:hypothetical protein